MKHLGLAIALSAGLACAPVAADTVQLDSGEWRHGSVKTMDADAVVLDAEGTLVRLPRDDVRSIHFSPPAPPTDELLTALKALTSSAELGFADYDRAVREVQPLVRAHLDGAREARRLYQIAEAFRLAFDAHHFVRAAWANFENRRAWAPAISGDAPLMNACPGLQDFLRTTKTWSRVEWHAGPIPEERYEPSLFLPEDLKPNLEAFWQCADSQIAEAERLIEERAR